MNLAARSVAPLVCGLAAFLSVTVSKGAFPTVALKAIVLKQIHSPTNIVHAGDGSGRLFIVDQPGKIYVYQGGMLLPTPFLNIASASNAAPDNGPGPVITVSTGYSERGLLGLAFHPGFSNPSSPGYRKFYVNYNKPYNAGSPDFDPAPPQAGDPTNCVTVISEFQVSADNANLADPLSERRLLRFTQPQSNHNGGQLEFGPDGMLYIGSGDGGGSNDNGLGHTGREVSTFTCLGNGQDRTRYLGKILRIDPVDPDGAGPLTYTIPADNPFYNDATPNLKKEIYAFGLRNPWKFSFDKRPGGTNRLFCGDVGQGRIEEINIITAGGNYAWRYKEGLELPAFSAGMAAPSGTLTDPIAMYAHPGVTTSPVLPQLGLSVTGGFVYRGASIPAMQGKYVFGDYGSTSGASDGRLMGLEETAPGSGVFTLTQAIPLSGQANPIVGQRILCLGEDETGEIYIGMKTNAGVLDLDPPTTGLPAGGIYKIVPLQSTSVSIPAQKDNTIFSDTVPTGGITGYPSDALGYLYAGRTGTNHGPYLRRALISFDIAGQLPAGAQIQTAQLKLRPTKLGPAAAGKTLALHRLSQTWGEGTSENLSDLGFGAQATTNDATWAARFYSPTSPQAWTTNGGAYTSTASASAVVALPTTTLPSTSQMVSDVQGWLTTPASNAGWILRGSETVNETVIQFSSVQKGGFPPVLEVTYEGAPTATRYETWLASHFPALLTGQYVGDVDGDGMDPQIEYAYGLDPTTHDATNSFSTGVAPGTGGATDLTVTYRRDTAATDITCKLQTSSGLSSGAWTTIAQSTAGAAPVGQNGGVIVSDVTVSGTIKLVTVRQTLPAGSNDRKFVRLRVESP